nr:MAG TPA: hypothetical protein [Caudoviricetes sp.]
MSVKRFHGIISLVYFSCMGPNPCFFSASNPHP